MLLEAVERRFGKHQAPERVEVLSDNGSAYTAKDMRNFADDTPIKMPAKGKCATARVWTYVRDERPWGGAGPPAAWYRFSTDRRVEHPEAHLANYSGWMHADGYAGFNDLYQNGVREVACLAHIRRKFVALFRSEASVIAEGVIRRIAELYAVEKAARGLPSDERVALRQRDDKPIFDDLKAWLGAQLTRIPGKSELVKAIRYALSRWPKMRPYLDHGILESDNNSAE